MRYSRTGRLVALCLSIGIAYVSCANKERERLPSETIHPTQQTPGASSMNKIRLRPNPPLQLSESEPEEQENEENEKHQAVFGSVDQRVINCYEQSYTGALFLDPVIGERVLVLNSHAIPEAILRTENVYYRVVEQNPYFILQDIEGFSLTRGHGEIDKQFLQRLDIGETYQTWQLISKYTNDPELQNAVDECLTLTEQEEDAKSDTSPLSRAVGIVGKVVKPLRSKGPFYFPNPFAGIIKMSQDYKKPNLLKSRYKPEPKFIRNSNSNIYGTTRRLRKGSSAADYREASSILAKQYPTTQQWIIPQVCLDLDLFVCGPVGKDRDNELNWLSELVEDNLEEKISASLNQCENIRRAQGFGQQSYPYLAWNRALMGVQEKSCIPLKIRENELK